MTTALSNVAKAAGLQGDQTFVAYDVKLGKDGETPGVKAASVPSRYHVAIGTPSGAKPDNVHRGIAVVAKELDGRIIGYRVYHQR